MVRASGRLYIFGSGGHGRVVAAAAQAAGWTYIEFLDPLWPRLKDAGGWPVSGDGRDLMALDGQAVIVAIGDNRRRLSVLDELSAAGIAATTIVHPTAWIAPGVALGAGSFVGARAVINVGATVDAGVIINTGAIVEHDCSLADGVHVSPGAVLAGGVKLAKGAWVGAGAVVRQSQTVGAFAIVGAGAAVVRDVPDGEVHVGVPARTIRQVGDVT